jgi:hypothetical protein
MWWRTCTSGCKGRCGKEMVLSLGLGILISSVHHDECSQADKVTGEHLLFWCGLKIEKIGNFVIVRVRPRAPTGTRWAWPSECPARLMRAAWYRCEEIARAAFFLPGGSLPSRGAPSHAWDSSNTAGWMLDTPPPACVCWLGWFTPHARLTMGSRESFRPHSSF